MLVPSQRSSTRLSDVIKDPALYADLNGRSMIVKKAKPLSIEVIVRGYLLGTGYKDYNRTGKVCGITLPAGLELASKLPEPIFTPSTKAEQGTHDENITYDEAANTIGADLVKWVKETSIELYMQAAHHAEKRGIIIADTKFEFGLINDQPVIIDEVLTPDSSRFWEKSAYHPGVSPPSFDKQIVRDYLETLKWDKKPPAPKLPKEIIKKTSARYMEVLEILKREA
jgi:phosphoribosylaminoimidazole-succinocarboxamide synthase